MKTFDKLTQLRNREITAEENIENYLDAIANENPNINAFIYIDRPRARERAREVDSQLKEGKAGPLAGLAIGVKSNINVKGYMVSCASQTLKNYIAPYDAEVVRRAEAAGAVVLGMLNMDEFACGSSGETSYFGPILNPVAPSYIPGGSSSGSAAAVAANLCDLTLGSDTGGSIRNPASHCGVVGIKPTYGRVPRHGLIDLAMSLDQIGPLSRDVEGAALLLDTICGYNPNEANSIDIAKPNLRAAITDKVGIEGMTVGICPMLNEATTPEIRSLFTDRLNKLQSKYGLDITEIELQDVDKALVTYYPIVYVEFFSATRKFDGRRYGKRIEEACGPEVLRRLKMGSHISQKEFQGQFYKKALKARSVINDAFSNAFEKCDIIASPTVPRLPHKMGEQITPLEMYGYDVLTIPANLAGVPAASVPVGTVNDIPVGFQVHADRFDEETLVKFMKTVEEIA